MSEVSIGENRMNGRRLSEDDEGMMFSGVERLKIQSENE